MICCSQARAYPWEPGQPAAWRPPAAPSPVATFHELLIVLWKYNVTIVVKHCSATIQPVTNKCQRQPYTSTFCLQESVH